jgi:hypothetical protein
MKLSIASLTEVVLCSTILGKLVELGDHPVHTHLGGELDFLRSCLVGRIGCGNGETVSALAQDEHAKILA